jgi:hypothetical protein
MCRSSLPSSLTKVVYQQQYYTHHLRTNEQSTLRNHRDDTCWKHDVIGTSGLSSHCHQQQLSKKRTAMLIQLHKVNNMITNILTETTSTFLIRKRRHEEKGEQSSECLLPSNKIQSVFVDVGSSDSTLRKRCKHDSILHCVNTDATAQTVAITNIDPLYSRKSSCCHFEQQKRQPDTMMTLEAKESLLSLMKELSSWERSCKDDVGASHGSSDERLRQLEQLRHRGEVFQRLYNSREKKLQQAFDQYGIGCAAGTDYATSRVSDSQHQQYKVSNISNLQSQHQLHCNHGIGSRQQCQQHRHVHFAEIARAISPRFSQSDHCLSSPTKWYCGDDMRTNIVKSRDLIQKYQQLYGQQQGSTSTSHDDHDDDYIDNDVAEYCDSKSEKNHHVQKTNDDNVITTVRGCMNFIGLEKRIVLSLRLQILQKFLAKRHVGMVLNLQRQRQRQQRCQYQQQQHPNTTDTHGSMNDNELYQNELAYASYITSYPCAKRANRTALLLRYELEKF